MNYLQLKQQASQFLEQDRYDKSIALYEQCIEIDPDELDNYWYLGLALMLQGNESLAQTVWMSVFLQADPEKIDILATDLIKILNRAALECLKSEHLSEAERLYLSMLEIDPNCADTYIGLGHIQVQRGYFEEAIETFTKFLELDPSFPTAYYNLGLCLHNLGKYKEAISYFQKTITLKDDYVGAYYYLGFCLQHEGNYESAIIHFKRTIELSPECVDAYAGVGSCLYRTRKYQQAINYFERGLKIKPDSPTLLCGIAVAYLDSIEDINVAKSYLYKAKTINPNFSTIYFNLAFCLRKEGKLQQAIDNFKKAVELYPEWTEPQNILKKLTQAIKASYYPKIEQEGYNVWDAMLFKDDNTYRLLYLGGSSKASPFWSVGEMAMATSTDLNRWQYKGVVLKPEENSIWENGRILAGSMHKENGIYYLFYSAASSQEILRERIGLATSIDGINWQKRSLSPLSELDNHYYGTYPSNYKERPSRNTPWRDPYIVKDSRSNKYYMFITTSLKEGEIFHKGCIGQAVSDRIDGNYEILPPVAVPLLEDSQECIYAEMERPQVIYKNDKYHLFFSTGTMNINPKWIDKVGRDRITESSLYWYVSDKITGSFEPVSEKPVVKGSEKTGLYGTNFLEDLNGNLFAYGADYQSKTLVVSPKFPVIWEGDSLEILTDEELNKI